MIELRKPFAALIGLCVGVSLTVSASAATSGPYRLSADRRYLVDGQGTPFFVHGEAAWMAIVNLTRAEATTYLDDCRSRGFNALLVNLIEHRFSAQPPANASGIKPFEGAAFQSATNAAYFEHVLWFVQAAAARDIVVFANPAYLGIGGGNEGWQQELEAATSAQAQSWGAFIGSKVAPAGNVVWHLFGDFDPPSHDRTNAVYAGIVSSSTRHTLFAHHFGRGVSSHEHREPWLSWNYLYPPAVGYMHVETLQGYAATPVVPQILGEAFYERDPQLPTTEDVRRQAWGALTSGAAGHFYGNRAIWGFGHGFEPADWRGALGDAGRLQMSHVKAFFSARTWWLLQPDTSSAWIIAGRGAIDSAGYVTAALASDKSWGIAYLPSSAGTLTVDRRKLAAPFQAKWFNPRTGAYTPIGTFPNTGTQQYALPTREDWVLTLEVPSAPGRTLVPALTPAWRYIGFFLLISFMPLIARLGRSREA